MSAAFSGPSVAAIPWELASGPRTGNAVRHFFSRETQRLQRGCGRQTAGAHRTTPISGEIGHTKCLTALSDGAECTVIGDRPTSSFWLPQGTKVALSN